MILITTYYKSQSVERQKEIDYCLEKNIENPLIETIYLLGNEIFEFSFLNKQDQQKIKQVKISDDPNYILKFSDAICFINQECIDKICILSNTDIYFDNTLKKIKQSQLCQTVFSLLRYDLLEDSSIEIFKRWDIPRNDSQDSWIFMSPLSVPLSQIDFEFGTLGCDSLFSSILYHHNYKIQNPSLDIISIHVHLSNHRTYDENKRIHGNYMLIDPSHLDVQSNYSFMDY